MIEQQEKKELKQPLFQQWLNRNPGVERFVSPKEWFLLLQYTIRSLKGIHSGETTRFLRGNLPNLFKADVPQLLAIEALLDLRLLLNEYIIDDTHAAEHIKQAQLNRLEVFFSLLFEVLEKVAQESVEIDETTNGDIVPEVKNGRHAREKKPELPRMIFYIDKDRFGGNCYLSQPLQSWTGQDAESFLEKADWDAVIHPEDIHEMKENLAAVLAENQRFYELPYRLMHVSENWKHIIEFGKVDYDAAGQPTNFTGLIVEVTDSSGAHVHDFSAEDLITSLIDSDEEWVLILDNRGYPEYISPGLQALLPESNPTVNRNGKPPSRSFSDLFGVSNQVVAAHFWQSLSEKGHISKKFMLKLEDTEKETTRHVEFSTSALQKIFVEPHYILKGKPAPSKAQTDAAMGKIALLNELTRDFYRTSDLNTFYKGLVAQIQRLIPGAQTAAVLLKTPQGFMFGIGSGCDQSTLAKKIVLKEKLSLNDGKDQSFLIDDQKIHEAIAGHLLDPIGAGAALQNGFYQANRQLLGVIRINNVVHTILQVGILDSGIEFSDADRMMMEFVAQQASYALRHHLVAYKLQENELNYCTIFEQSPLAIFILQKDELKLFNHKLLSLLSISNKDALQKDIWQYFHPEDVPVLKGKMAMLNAGPGSEELEFRMRDEFGEEIYCLGALSHIQYNRKPAVLCELHDISRLRKLENQALHARKMETLGSLATGIAHDFNNILGTIIPSAQLILKNPQGESTKKRAEMIFNMSQRAAALTQQLLSFAKSRQQRTDICNMNGLVLEARDVFDSIIGPAISLQFGLEENLPNIYGDRDQLMQLLSNLIMNARDAMPRGGTIQIKTSQQKVIPGDTHFQGLPAGDYVRATVQDNGSGIPKEIRDQIFKPFFTTKSDASGAGLGLSIVYGILKKHNGYVMLDSVENKGSTFDIFLPVTEKKRLVPAPEKPPQPAAEEAPAGKTVLIVDDESNLRDVFDGMIKLLGHHCIEAASGKEAIQIYKAHTANIDLVVLDYGMKDMNGKQVYHLLKEINPAIKVLLCTGYGEQKEVADLIEKHKLHLMPKPFTIEILSQKLDDFFGE